MRAPFEEFAYRQAGGASLVDHRHVNGDGYELIQVLSGEGSALIFDRTYPLRPGALLLIDASYPHCLHPADMTGYVRSKLILDRAYLRGVFSTGGCLHLLDEMTGEHGGLCVYPDEGGVAQADRLFAQMRDAFEGEASELCLHVLSALLPLFALLRTAGSGDGFPELPHGDEKLAPVLGYLRAHCAEPLTVDEIAQAHHISKYYLCRLFRQTTGMTIMGYLYEQRFSLARRLLAGTEQSISTIALSCGFGSSSHFCTMFRRREGCSPNAYRRRCQQPITPAEGKEEGSAHND